MAGCLDSPPPHPWTNRWQGRSPASTQRLGQVVDRAGGTAGEGGLDSLHAEGDRPAASLEPAGRRWGCASGAGAARAVLGGVSGIVFKGTVHNIPTWAIPREH